MTRRSSALAVAAALWCAAVPLAAQTTPSNPFAIERASPPADGWRSGHEHRHAREHWRMERRGERLQRHGNRLERHGRSWERRGERLERRGHEYRGRAWQRKGEHLQRRDRLEHRGRRLERRAERHHGGHHRRPTLRYRVDGRI
ncbi:MAG TPA: hypothetical protein VFN40_04810 [Gemmatimonadales bacterium]|nr:hypothetical protein [Gemmatimonadales bacterium]